MAVNNIAHLCLLEWVHRFQAEATANLLVAHIANLNMTRILLTCNMAMSIARRAYELIPPEYTCIVSTTVQIRHREMTIFLEEKERCFSIDKLKPHSGLSVVKILSRSNTMVVIEAILVLLPKRKQISTV